MGSYTNSQHVQSYLSVQWHFTIRGADESDYAGGRYHGRILLPSQYPFRPPDIMLLTPSGRFQCSTKICLSISSFHAETWQPSWSIRTVLTALIAFFTTPAAGAIGSLDYPSSERRALAAKSRHWMCSTEACPVHGQKLSDVLPEVSNPEPAPTLEVPITFKAQQATATDSTNSDQQTSQATVDVSSSSSSAVADSSSIAAVAQPPTSTAAQLVTAFEQSASSSVQPASINVHKAADQLPASQSPASSSSTAPPLGLHHRHAAAHPNQVDSPISHPSTTSTTLPSTSHVAPSPTAGTDAVLAASTPSSTPTTTATTSASMPRKRELTDEEYSLVTVVTVMMILAILLRKLLGRALYDSDPFYFDLESWL